MTVLSIVFVAALSPAAQAFEMPFIPFDIDDLLWWLTAGNLSASFNTITANTINTMTLNATYINETILTGNITAPWFIATEGIITPWLFATNISANSVTVSDQLNVTGNATFTGSFETNCLHCEGNETVFHGAGTFEGNVTAPNIEVMESLIVHGNSTCSGVVAACSDAMFIGNPALCGWTVNSGQRGCWWRWWTGTCEGTATPCASMSTSTCAEQHNCVLVSEEGFTFGAGGFVGNITFIGNTTMVGNLNITGKINATGNITAPWFIATEGMTSPLGEFSDLITGAIWVYPYSAPIGLIWYSGYNDWVFQNSGLRVDNDLRVSQNVTAQCYNFTDGTFMCSNNLALNSTLSGMAWNQTNATYDLMLSNSTALWYRLGTGLRPIVAGDSVITTGNVTAGSINPATIGNAKEGVNQYAGIFSGNSGANKIYLGGDTYDIKNGGTFWVDNTGQAYFGSLINAVGGLIVSDSGNIALGTVTGTMIGTTTSQKLGFFSATPIIQPSSTTDLKDAMTNLGLLASGGATPLNLDGGNLLTTGDITGYQVSATNYMEATYADFDYIYLNDIQISSDGSTISFDSGINAPGVDFGGNDASNIYDFHVSSYGYFGDSKITGGSGYLELSSNDNGMHFNDGSGALLQLNSGGDGDADFQGLNIKTTGNVTAPWFNGYLNDTRMMPYSSFNTSNDSYVTWARWNLTNTTYEADLNYTTNTTYDEFLTTAMLYSTWNTTNISYLRNDIMNSQANFSSISAEHTNVTLIQAGTINSSGNVNVSRNITTGIVLSSDGNFGMPAFGFSSDPRYGLYKSGASILLGAASGNAMVWTYRDVTFAANNIMMDNRQHVANHDSISSYVSGTGRTDFISMRNDNINNAFLTIWRPVQGASNASFNGSLSVGASTLDGLLPGDINVSIVYHDALSAKSPVVMCSGNTCKVEVIEDKQTYYIMKDDNWSIVSATDSKGSPSILPPKVTDKFAYLEEKKGCEDSGGTLSASNACTRESRHAASYAEATEKASVPETKVTETTCQRLNDNLEVETYSCTKEVETGKRVEKTIFKTGCGWTDVGGYYCMSQDVLVVGA